jgi:hemoglobin
MTQPTGLRPGGTTETHAMTTMELKTAEAPNPHFARIGGAPAVRRLVDAFYRRMESLPEAAGIRAMHGEDLTEIKSVLELYLTEWLGGAKEYSQRRGPPRLRARHSPFPIGVAERDAWMACMRGALAEVVVDADLRGQLESAFLRTANAIVNQAAPVTAR